VETTNRKQIRSLWRLAGLIAEQYQPPPQIAAGDNFANLTDELIRIQHKLRVARQNQWWLAAANLQSRYEAELERLRTVLAGRIQASQNPPGHNSLGQSFPSQHSLGLHYAAQQADIFRDLQALQTEFAGYQFQPVGKLLSVATAPVQLEGTWLGTFQISLEVASLSRVDHGHYEVIALDPYPASSNDDVVHPHVQAGTLCAGDAQMAIWMALKQGRLLDFFQLVNNVLHTYNSSSAYVSLDDWGAVNCYDCGQLNDSDDCCICSGCDDRVCEACWCCCVECDEHHCSACNVPCSDCGDDVCKSCIRPCLGCGENFCSSCLNENERCKSCEPPLPEKEENDDNHENDDARCDHDLAHAAVHADSMDQAAVLA